MRLPPLPASIFAGLLSVCVLGAVWLVVLQSLSPRQVTPDDSSPRSSTVIPQHDGPAQSQPNPSLAEMPDLVPQPSSAPVPVSSPPLRTSMPERIPSSEESEAVCRAELEALCRDASPQGGARRRCIEEKARQLAPVCQTMLRERLMQLKTFASNMKMACEEDARRLCRSVSRRRGAMVQCLEDHSNQLSAGCARTLAQRNSGREHEQ